MLALLLSMAAALSLPAMTAEEVTPENLAAALSAAGYEACQQNDKQTLPHGMILSLRILNAASPIME